MNDDLISRQAAIDAIEKHIRFGEELYPLTETDRILNHAFEIAASCVYNLPSAERKRGRWVWSESEWHYKCSSCGTTFDYNTTYELFDHGFQFANYCPNCGADMRGEEYGND